jgi:hypothetical protein
MIMSSTSIESRYLSYTRYVRISIRRRYSPYRISIRYSIRSTIQIHL